LRFFQSLSDITMMVGITMIERDELWHDEYDDDADDEM
jgi:hypothetical protein